MGIVIEQGFLVSDTNVCVFLGIVSFYPGKQNPIMTFENYEYRVHRKFQSKTYWSCRGEQKYKCRARITTAGKTLFVKNNLHNHEPTTPSSEPLLTQTVVIKRKYSEASDFI